MSELQKYRSKLIFAVIIAIISILIAYVGLSFDEHNATSGKQTHAKAKTHSALPSRTLHLDKPPTTNMSKPAQVKKKNINTSQKANALRLRLHQDNQGILTQIPKVKTARGTSLSVVKKEGPHTKFQQYIDGLPVFGIEVIHHKNEKGSFYSGELVTELSNHTGTKPSIAAEEALNIALAHHGVDRNTSHRHTTALQIYVDRHNQASLSYLVGFDTKRPASPARMRYIIDANDKQVLKHWNELMSEHIGTGPGGNEAIGRYEYGVDKPFIDISKETGTPRCQLNTTEVATYDARHLDDIDDIYDAIKKKAIEPVSFICPRHEADDEINGAYSPVNDAHYFGTVIVNMYKDWYGKRPLPFTLKFIVHFDTGYENAAWDPSNRVMIFGDGANDFYPLVALDVTSHEVAHGITQANSNLAYFDESGGLNESFSDIAGKAAVYYLNGNNDWTLGIEIKKNHQPLRYMDEPTRDGKSIDNARDFEDDMNPHRSSGVFNKLFYKLATSEGYNTRRAFDLMYEANKHYWTKLANFESATEGLLDAAIGLDYPKEAIINAAKEVGIHCIEKSSRYRCNIAPDPDRSEID